MSIYSAVTEATFDNVGAKKGEVILCHRVK